jgi:hypothetical protein
MAFPNTYSTAVSNVTPIQAIHLNNLEAKVGINGDTPGTNPLAIQSLDYMINAKLDTAIYTVDHDLSGHHISGGWHIGVTAVTSTAAELNKLTGTSANVTPANLNTLTGGGDASALHVHGLGEYIFIKDIKSAGTHGGTFTNGAWRTRDLTLIETDDTGVVTLVANQFTLPAGTYVCDISVPAVNTDRHKSRLQNVTDATTTLLGSSTDCGSNDNDESSSFIKGKFTIAISKTFEVQHRCQTTAATFGFGVASNFAVSEVYTQIKLLRIA